MSSNRFDTSQTYQPVSTYVPLPFETIAALGEKANKNFAEGKQAEADLGALGQAIKAAPMHQDDRKAFIDSYNNKLKTLIDEAKGDYGSKDFQAKANALTNEFKNDPKVQAFKGTLDAYEEYTKRKGKEGADRDLDFTYEKDAAGNFIQKDVLKDGKYSSRFTNYADAYKAQSDIMNNIASSSFGGSKGYDFSDPRSGVGPGGEYYAYNKVTGKTEKVDKKDIQRVAEASVPLYAKTDAGLFELQSEAKKYLGDEAYNLNYDKLNELASVDPNYKVLLDQINSKFYTDLSRVGEKQKFNKSFTDVDNMTLGDRNRAKANDTKEILDNLRASTVDGRTNNAIQGDTTFGNLFNSEVFKEKDGVVTFDPMALITQPSVRQGFTTGSMGSYQGSGTTVNKLTSTEKSKMLQDQLVKMTKAVPGFTIEELSKNGHLDPNKVSQLATAYNELTKSRSLDLNLAPAVQETESDLANLNWYNVKQVDPNKPENTLDNTPLGEDEKVVVVNRRTDNKGHMYNEGFIKNTKTNELKPIAFRSQSTEKNLVFDALGKIQKASIDNLSEDNYIKDSNNKDLTIHGITTKYGKSDMKVVGEEKIGNGYYIQSLADPNKKYNTLYLIRNNNNEIVSMKQSLGELKKDVENFYFTQIPEGRTELELLKSKTKKAENQQDAGQ